MENSSVTNIINLLYKRLERLKDVQIKKNIVIPQKIPPEGIIILRSGKCEIVETILSPVSYVLELRPELEVLVQDMDDDNRHNQMSKIIKKYQTVSNLIFHWVEMLTICIQNPRNIAMKILMVLRQLWWRPSPL